MCNTLCKICKKLKELGIDEEDIKKSHLGKITLGDLLGKYPNDTHEIYQAYEIEE